MITNNLSTLKINKLTQAQYDKALSEGRINDNELYLTPDSGTIDIDISALDSKYLHNFTINLSHQTGGNPRESKFLTVDYSAYTSNYATYIKLSAASCHGNGSSYQFLEDILIGVSTEGNSITCKVIKYCQSSVNSTSSYGDVFYVLDSTNKKVYFYILGGQWANTLFTPFTVIGSATGTGVTQHSGAAEYYSTGDKVMAQGNNTLLFNCVDTISDQTISGDKTFTNGIKVRGNGTVLNNEGTAVTENVETTVNPTGIRLESYSTTNYYDFPTNSGTLAVVSYDKSSHTLTIKA